MPLLPLASYHFHCRLPRNQRRLFRDGATVRARFDCQLYDHLSLALWEQAADVVGLLDRLEITAAVLVGHSMGGKVAMATALLHPGRVSALCVIDIAPVRYSVADGSDWRLADAMVRELAKLPLHELSSKRDADARLSGAIVDPAMRAFALTNLLEDLCATSGQKTLAWKINLVAIEQQLRVVAGADLPAGVRPFKGPTLFVKGGASRCVSKGTF